MPEDNRHGFVYIWRDRKYNRYYIGCHWGHENDSYVCSSTWMRNSFRNRPQDFKRRILETGIEDRSEMYVREQAWLDLIDRDEIKPNTTEPRYYNLSLSSKNVWHKDPELAKTVGQKISEAKKGKKTGPRSQETKDKISKANKGRKRTEEQRANLSEALVGRVSPRKGVTLSEETRAKISENLSGHTQSEETIEKRSESLRRAYATRSDEDKAQTAQNISRALARTWVVTDPHGNEYEVTNLKQFCNENGLTNTNITRASGSKGWRATKSPGV